MPKIVAYIALVVSVLALLFGLVTDDVSSGSFSSVWDVVSGVAVYDGNVSVIGNFSVDDSLFINGGRVVFNGSHYVFNGSA